MNGRRCLGSARQAVDGSGTAGVTRSGATAHWTAYVVAATAVAVAAALRQLLDPVLGPNRPFIFFFAAVPVAAWYGGLWAGVVSVRIELSAGQLAVHPAVLRDQLSIRTVPWTGPIC